MAASKDNDDEAYFLHGVPLARRDADTTVQHVYYTKQSYLNFFIHQEIKNYRQYALTRKMNKFCQKCNLMSEASKRLLVSPSLKL